MNQSLEAASQILRTPTGSEFTVLQAELDSVCVLFCFTNWIIKHCSVCIWKVNLPRSQNTLLRQSDRQKKYLKLICTQE